MYDMDVREAYIPKYFELVLRTENNNPNSRRNINNWRIKGIYNKDELDKNREKCDHEAEKQWDKFNWYPTSPNDILVFIKNVGVDRSDVFWKHQWCKHGSKWFYTIDEFFYALRDMYLFLNRPNWYERALEKDKIDFRNKSSNKNCFNNDCFLLQFNILYYNKQAFFLENNQITQRMLQQRQKQINSIERDLKNADIAIQIRDERTSRLEKKLMQVQNKCTRDKLTLQKENKQLEIEKKRIEKKYKKCNVYSYNQKQKLQELENQLEKIKQSGSNKRKKPGIKLLF